MAFLLNYASAFVFYTELYGMGNEAYVVRQCTFVGSTLRW